MRALITDEEAREAAREILSAEAYTRWSSEYEAWLDLFDRITALIPDFVLEALSALFAALGKIGDWIQAFLNALGIEGSVAPFLGWLGVLAIAGVLIASIAQWRMRTASMRTAAAGTAGETDRHAEAVREAQRAAGDGLFLEAAHRVQLASLAFLIDAGWVELARSDANPTLRQRVSNSALPERERVQLIALVDRFERRWFGAVNVNVDIVSAVQSESESDAAPFSDRTLYEDWLALDSRLSRLGFRSKAA